MGLGFAVAAFVGFSLVATDDSATAQEAVKDAVSKLGDIPAVIAGSCVMPMANCFLRKEL